MFFINALLPGVHCSVLCVVLQPLAARCAPDTLAPPAGAQGSSGLLGPLPAALAVLGLPSGVPRSRGASLCVVC